MAKTMALRAEDMAMAEGVIRVITLQDQDRRNAFTPDMVAGLGEEIARAERDEHVGAVVLTHTGRVFCAGTDLTHLTSIAADQDRVRAFLADLVGLIRRLETLPKFTVAAIEGPAVGGGLELALACDVRVLGSDAWVRLPEVTLGAVPGGGGVQRLTRFVGRGRALRTVLLAQRLDARSCAGLGLAEVVDAGAALSTAIEMAATASGHARVAMASAKRIIHLAEELALEDLDAIAVDAMVEALGSAEGREGLSAVREKRRPDFTDARASDARATDARARSQDA